MMIDTINGGLRQTLAAIRQERENNRRVKKELDRQRMEIHRKNREAEKEKRQEAEAWLRRFTLVRFCAWGKGRKIYERRG